MSEKQQKSMLVFAKDLPNICSLLGFIECIIWDLFCDRRKFPCCYYWRFVGSTIRLVRWYYSPKNKRPKQKNKANLEPSSIQ